MMCTGEEVKKRLEREVFRVNRFIETLRHGDHSEEMESGGDNTPLSESADATHIVEEREIVAELMTRLTDKAAALDEALRRIAKGTYGLCARCARPIHEDRLRALPEARLCLDCQTETEGEPRPRPSGGYRWIEAADRGREEIERG